jgi:hypothetical protein
MHGAIPPFPNTPSQRGAQLKHRDNFTSSIFCNTKKLTNPLQLCLAVELSIVKVEGKVVPVL